VQFEVQFAFNVVLPLEHVAVGDAVTVKVGLLFTTKVIEAVAVHKVVVLVAVTV
jgi:hypothetical protein